MKKHNPIRPAINESLSGVRFNAHDARSVLSAVRAQQPGRPVRIRRAPRAGFAVSIAAVLVIVPLALFVLRAQGGTTIASHSMHTPIPDIVSYLTPAPESTAAQQPALITGDEAVRAARACFEAACDTGVFTFEEYTVAVQYSADTQSYAVRMTSIYDNGCSFLVSVSAADGSILSHSDAAHATTPAHINMDSVEVQSWFEKNGEDFLTWPQDQQDEFRRRYEGVCAGE